MSLIRLTIPIDSHLETSAGQIEGRSKSGFAARDIAIVSADFKTLWGGDGDPILPTTATTMELLSDNAADTSAGTGLRTVFVSGLDTSHDPTSETITMNGVTPVVTANTYIRVGSILALTTGSNGANVGEVQIRESGGGNPQSFIMVGDNRSYTGVITVPNGQTMFTDQFTAYIPKNESIDFLLETRRNVADAPWVPLPNFSAYQNVIVEPITSKIPLTQEVDIRVRGKSTNENVSATFVFQTTLIENDQLPAAVWNFLGMM